MIFSLNGIVVLVATTTRAHVCGGCLFPNCYANQEGPLCCSYTPFYPQKSSWSCKKHPRVTFLHSQKSNVNANSIMKSDSESTQRKTYVKGQKA